MTALRILVVLARAVRRQIGNTVLGGCNRLPSKLRKVLPSKFCLFGAAPSRENFFFKKTSSTILLRQTKVHYTYVFFIEALIFCQYIYFFVLDFKST